MILLLRLCRYSFTCAFRIFSACILPVSVSLYNTDVECEQVVIENYTSSQQCSTSKIFQTALEYTMLKWVFFVKWGIYCAFRSIPPSPSPSLRFILFSGEQSSEDPPAKTQKDAFLFSRFFCNFPPFFFFLLNFFSKSSLKKSHPI